MTNLSRFLDEFSSTEEFEQWIQNPITLHIFLAHIHELATSSDEFTSSLSSQFIWNLQYVVGKLLWDQRIAEPIRLNLLDDISVLVAAIASSESSASSDRSPSLHQFWESVVEVGERPVNRDNQVIFSALFECLKSSSISAIH
jgi:hypothetical protein